MSNYSGNYGNVKLCQCRNDVQKMRFQCERIKEKIIGSYSNIFSENILPDIAQTTSNIDRKE